MFELFPFPFQRVRAANMAVRTRLLLRTSLSLIALVFASFIVVGAQTRPQNSPTPPEPNAGKPGSSEDNLGLGSIDEEMRVKQNIKLLEKEYKQNVGRAREAAELGAQLRDAIKQGKPFGREETKKLERLEKLAKKIRDEAGGSDEDTSLSNPPGKLESALTRLAEVAESLFKVVEKTPRQVISAAVIEKANALLQLTRITRNLFR
jgi:hypothetical protein